MTTLHQLSKALEAARVQRGLSTSDLSGKAGVSRAGLYRFAAGGDIRLSTFLALADSLALDVVLAPQAVSSSLQSTLNTEHRVMEAASTAVGPRSAVEVRMQRAQAALLQSKRRHRTNLP